MGNRTFQLFFLFIPLMTISGCSLFFGNIKPIIVKSTSYVIMNLSQMNSHWTAIPFQGSELGKIDIAYRLKTTGSMIALNSACQKQSTIAHPPPLQGLTRELILGFSEIQFKEETALVIAQIPALQMILRGTIQNEKMMLRAIVLEHRNCIYDLFYIARPDVFEKNNADFSRFVSSLQLKGK